MKLSAFDCLRRGWTNLSANWELVLLQWIESLVVLVLLALGLVLPLTILGVDLGGSGRSEAREIGDALRRLDAGTALPLALAAMLAVGLLTLLVHCFVQAGTYGILTAADRQALPGAGRSKLLFRTFTLRDFCGWGALYVWRFFRLLLLTWGLVLLLGVTVLLWMVFLGVGGVQWGAPAALGIGCGALPLGFLALVLGLWLPVAQASLAREGAGVRSASRLGLAVLGQRLGAVLVLFFVFFAAFAGLAVAFAPLAAVAEGWLAGAPRLGALVQFLLLLLQSFPNTLLALALAGSLVALVRSEMRSDIRQPEVQTA